MIPKVLYGLYLIQNLDTNYLLQKNKQREKLEIKKEKLKKKKKKKEKKRFSHSHNTKRTEYRTELMYRAKEWIRIAAARV